MHVLLVHCACLTMVLHVACGVGPTEGGGEGADASAAKRPSG